MPSLILAAEEGKGTSFQHPEALTALGQESWWGPQCWLGTSRASCGSLGPRAVLTTIHSTNLAQCHM